MSGQHRSHTWGAMFAGACLGALLYALLTTSQRPARAQAQPPTVDVQSLAAEIAAIKTKLPDQSHVMKDVSYHFGNLWFAGQNENWDLADFYWSETRSHLRWAVRIIPKRKDKAGREVDLESILQAMENTPLKQLQEAIKAKDGDAFVKAYRFTLETCYGCHKAADKPFLHPKIPTQPETQIVNFDTTADWPK
jgi:hypothetical protein